MRKDDILLSLLALGLWITRMERSGDNGTILTPHKHAWLRLHWWMLKNPSFPPTPSLTEEGLQTLQQIGHIEPSWLPCHKLPLHIDAQPCNSHSKFCHCAQLLQCELEEGVYSSS